MPNNKDYQQGKIYTIRCRDDSALIYVGSTISPLSSRWSCHKTHSVRRPNTLLYKIINNKWHKWYIQLYEDYPCENQKQLCKREGEIIKLIGTLNINMTEEILASMSEQSLNNVINNFPLSKLCMGNSHRFIMNVNI